MSKLAQKRSVSRSTISRAVKEDLGMKLYVRRVRNLLTTHSRALRGERCPKVLNHIKHKGEHDRVFVDEKSSLLMRLQIARTLGQLPSILQKFLLWCRAKIPLLWWFLNPSQVIVRWCLLISSKQVLKSTQRSTWKFWKMFWCRGYVRTTTPSKWCLFKTSAPAHGAKKVHDFLKENLPLMVPKYIWPSSSPDLNVCDYWLFGVIEGESNVTSHSSVNSLKAAIRWAWRCKKELFTVSLENLTNYWRKR